jgi:hypothetical protein
MVLTMENPLPIATMNDVDDNYVVRWIRRKKKEKVRNRKDEDSLVLFAEDIEDITHLIWWLVVVISRHCRSNQSTFFWFNLTEILWFVSPSSLPYCLYFESFCDLDLYCFKSNMESGSYITMWIIW